MNKKALTEADIRTKFITPAIVGPGGAKWDLMTQVLEERYFTKGRVIVRGKACAHFTIGSEHQLDLQTYADAGPIIFRMMAENFPTHAESWPKWSN
jgi:hypothetical protein